MPGVEMTFCFTDIAGSTELFRRLGEAAYTEVLERHRQLIREALAECGGIEVKTEGDGFFLAFEQPAAAVRFAVEAQQALSSEPWSVPVEVRMGLHSGPARRREDGDFVALSVHRAARVVAAAHGGQVLLTVVLEALAPTGCGMRGLGQYLLRDFDGPVTLLQLEAPGLTDGFAPPRAARVLHGLPIPRTSLIGRAAELTRLRHDITAGQLLTIVGPGGVGKSRLCLEAMAELAPSYPDGVHLVELSAASDADAVIGTALAALKAVPRPDQDPLDALAHAMHGSRLVLLDSCERCLDGVAPMVKELLDRCPGLALLATCTEPIRVPGERRLVLGPLPVPAEDDPGAEAVQLLHQRAVAGGATYELDDVAGELSQIARRLDGIPLALELAAGRIVELGVDQVVAGLEDRFSMLTNGFRTALPRHQTLEGMVAWTVELLDDEDQEVYRRICCVDGRWPLAKLPAAVGLAPDAVVSIRRLADRSLLSLVGAGSRVYLLDTVRLFGRRQAGAALLADVRGCLARHLSHVALRDGIRSLSEMDRVAEMSEIIADVRSLLADPPLDHDQELAGIASTFYTWYEYRGLHREALSWLRGLLDGPVSPHVNVMVTAAHAAMAVGEVAYAEELARRTLEVENSSTEARLMACEVLDTLGAQFADGTDPLEHALALVADDPGNDMAPTIRSRWSWRLFSRGQLDEALQVIDEVIALRPPGVVPGRECHAREHRANVLIALGRLDEAAADLAEVERLIERYDLVPLRGPWLSAQAGLSLRLGDLPRCLELADARIALARDQGDLTGELAALSLISTVALTLGDLSRGRAAAERSVELSEGLRRFDVVIIGRFNLVVLETADGRLGPARTHASAGLALALKIPVPPLQLLSLAAAVGVLSRESDPRGLTLAAVFERLATGPDAIPTPMDSSDHEWLEASIAQAADVDQAKARAAAEGMDLAAALELAATALA